MMPLTEIAHQKIRSVIRPGDVAIDATVGNGHDTLFLATCVGPEGCVYGFDVQPEALSATLQRVNSAGLHNVHLIHRSHAELLSALPERLLASVRVVMLNLGYLPGGNKKVTTQAESTTAAIQAGLSLLNAGGIMTILAYVGHAGGSEEAAAVVKLLGDLPTTQFHVCEEISAPQRAVAPRLFIVEKTAER